MTQLTAQLDNVAFSMDGSQIISLKTKNDCRALYDEFNGKELSVQLKLYRKKRSRDANAFFWTLLDKLCAKMHVGKQEQYISYIKNIGGNSNTVCVINEAVEDLCTGWEHNGLGWPTETFESKLPGCTNVTLYKGSSTYDTEQMSRLIDMLIQDCKAVGIDTATPAEIEEILSLWGEK